MRAMFCAIALVAGLAAPSYAQTSGAAYLEVGGSGLYYSVNGELPIGGERTVRVGGMTLPGPASGGTASINQLIGRGNGRFILGLGATFARGHGINLGAATATIGYRYAIPGGMFVQYALTPFFTTDGPIPWSGISVGKSF